MAYGCAVWPTYYTDYDVPCGSRLRADWDAFNRWFSIAKDNHTRYHVLSDNAKEFTRAHVAALWTARFKRDSLDIEYGRVDRIVARGDIEAGYEPPRCVVALGCTSWQRVVALAALLLLGCASWAISRTGSGDDAFDGVYVDDIILPPASTRSAGG